MLVFKNFKILTIKKKFQGAKLLWQTRRAEEQKSCVSKGNIGAQVSYLACIHPL